MGLRKRLMRWRQKVFIDKPDPDRTVGTDEVGGKADGAFIDDGGGFLHGL